MLEKIEDRIQKAKQQSVKTNKAANRNSQSQKASTHQAEYIASERRKKQKGPAILLSNSNHY